MDSCRSSANVKKKEQEDQFPVNGNYGPDVIIFNYILNSNHSLLLKAQQNFVIEHIIQLLDLLILSIFHVILKMQNKFVATKSVFLISKMICHTFIQGVIESCIDILTTSYWLHVKLGKNI
jgi:hypothetical protein